MKLSVGSIASVLFAATAGLIISAPKADALTVNLSFVDVDIEYDPETDSFPGTYQLVGTGTLSFDGDISADGTYKFAELQNFNFLITFGNDTFDNSNLVATLENSFFTGGSFGSSQPINFIDTVRDSIDFYNPNNSSQIFLNLYKDTFYTADFDRKVVFRGNVTAENQIPTPALLPGLIGMGIGVLRNRRAEQKV